jgi:hypothetical protein
MAIKRHSSITDTGVLKKIGKLKMREVTAIIGEKK